MKDFYKILEVNSEATQEEIKRSYRRLAQKYHPDRNGNDKIFEDKQKEINEAYATLNDLNKKNIYDINYKKFYSSSNTGSSFKQQNGNHQENHFKKEEKKTEEKTEAKQNNFQRSKMSNNIKSNFRKTFLSKPSIFISVLVFIAIVLLAYNWKSVSAYFEEKERKQKYDAMVLSIQEAKTYPERSIPSLKVASVKFETRWKDGKMYYKFSFSGASPKTYDYKNLDTALLTLLNDAPKNDFEQKMNNVVSFDINLMDKDGFKIHTMKVERNQMTRIVGNNGNVVGYSINTNIDLAPEIYKDFDNWELTYIER